MTLGPRFQQAVGEALRLHAHQTRKGTEIPYPAHLLATAALVLQFGGDEDQAIAGLLHDAAEDAGGRPTLDRIREMFGDAVAGMVEGCTDTFEEPKPPWRARKEAYIARIPSEPKAALLVSACDKLDNARAIVADLRRDGVGALSRFRGGLDTVWYYRTIAGSFLSVADARLARVVQELVEVVGEMQRLCGSATPGNDRG